MCTYSLLPLEIQRRKILLQSFTYPWILLINNDISLGARVWGPVAMAGLETSLAWAGFISLFKCLHCRL